MGGEGKGVGLEEEGVGRGGGGGGGVVFTFFVCFLPCLCALSTFIISV